MSRSDPRTLGFDAEVERLTSAIEASDPGDAQNVAVVSEPWGGRDRLLDHVEARSDGTAERIRLTPTSRERPDFDWPEADVLLVDDCQHLYARKIGGFDVLEAFLHTIVEFEGPVVTSWNVFSWRYLRTISDLERSFPIRIELADLDREEIAAFIESEHDGDPPEYVDTEETLRAPLVAWVERPLRLWGDRTVTVPTPVPNRERVRRRWVSDGDPSTETLIFEKLTRLAGGNPGIARRLWEEYADEGRIELGEVREPSSEFAFDYQTGFLLQTVLAKERIRIDELAEVVDHPDLDRALAQLSRERVLTVTDDVVGLDPWTVAPIIKKLEQRRILW